MRFTMKSTQSTKKSRNAKQNNVRVLAFGTFDILHPGHLFYLNAAKKLGNELVVVIARDVNVFKSKGNVPVNNEMARWEIVAALKPVDKAVLGNTKNIYDKVKELHPQIMALGYDQHLDLGKLKRELKKRKLNCRVVRLKPFKEAQFKSAIIKHKIRKQKK